MPQIEPRSELRINPKGVGGDPQTWWAAGPSPSSGTKGRADPKHLSDGQPAYPFNAPAASPWMKYRLRNMNITRSGIAISVDPAIISPQRNS